MRGDEPVLMGAVQGVPRMRGDEPDALGQYLRTESSPHARG